MRKIPSTLRHQINTYAHAVAQAMEHRLKARLLAECERRIASGESLVDLIDHLARGEVGDAPGGGLILYDLAEPDRA